MHLQKQSRHSWQATNKVDEKLAYFHIKIVHLYLQHDYTYSLNCHGGTTVETLKFCFKTCVAMKFVDDDDDECSVL